MSVLVDATRDVEAALTAVEESAVVVVAALPVAEVTSGVVTVVVALVIAVPEFVFVEAELYRTA